MKLFVVTLLVAGAMAGPTRLPNIPELAERLGATDLVKAVIHAGLAEALSGPGPFTVAAPTNKAFQSLPGDVLEELMRNRTALAEVLKYHVHMGKVMSADAMNDQLFSTLQGTKARVNIYGNGAATINGASIDLDALDQMASNGVVHVMDKVIYPIPTGTVVDAAVGNMDFSTLVTALKAADLVDTLNGAGPFTVFAPTNAAFAKIPAQELEKLLADKKALTAVLLYHVVASTQYSAGLTDGANVATVNGESVTISVSDSGVMVNDAKVVIADLSVTNGVIHAIDTVLMPPKY